MIQKLMLRCRTITAPYKTSTMENSISSNVVLQYNIIQKMMDGVAPSPLPINHQP
jgi:hypothetical protein